MSGCRVWISCTATLKHSGRIRRRLSALLCCLLFRPQCVVLFALVFSVFVCSAEKGNRRHHVARRSMIELWFALQRQNEALVVIPQQWRTAFASSCGWCRCSGFLSTASRSFQIALCSASHAAHSRGNMQRRCHTQHQSVDQTPDLNGSVRSFICPFICQLTPDPDTVAAKQHEILGNFENDPFAALEGLSCFFSAAPKKRGHVHK